MENLTIRPATVDDADAIGNLIMDLLPFLTLHPDGEGAEAFIANVGIAAQRRYLAQDNYQYHVALREGALAGAVAMRDNSHLFHLFVAQALHGQGLGRQLWLLARDEAIARGNPGVFTVNASTHGMPMYLRLGFVATGPRVEHDGIADMPMQWVGTVPAGACPRG